MTRTSTRVFFQSMQKDDKKTVIKLQLKGNISDTQMMQLMNLAGTIVDVDFITPQTDIDDYALEDRKGVTYSVNNDGTVDGAQMDLDDVAEQNAEAVAAYEEVAQANREAAASAEDALPFDDLDDELE